MSHRSQLAGFIIDCQTGDLDEAAQFWSRALGLPAQSAADVSDPVYRGLNTPHGDPYLEVQSVDHPSRVHLDIESDDIEAEAQRLEKLGAKRIATVKSWVVMEAPTGHRFCIVSPHRAHFETTATTWEES